MTDGQITGNMSGSRVDNPLERRVQPAAPQKVLVFQQNGSGENKIAGIRRFGSDVILLETVCIDEPVPPMVDDSEEFLPGDIHADLVLDYLRHPDLSHDLAALCLKRGIPVIAPGKKLRVEGVVSPPT